MTKASVKRPSSLEDRIALLIRRNTMKGISAEVTAGDVLELLARDRPAHPGEILKELLIDRRLSPDQAAVLCGLHPDAVAGLVHRPGVLVSETIAEGLGKGLGPSAQWWLDAQDEYFAGLAREAAGATRERTEDATA